MKPEEFRELCRLIRSDATARMREQKRKDSACTGKHRFESFKAAESTLSQRLRKRARVYHCRECWGFHIGNVTSQRRNRLVIARRRQCEFA